MYRLSSLWKKGAHLCHFIDRECDPNYPHRSLLSLERWTRVKILLVLFYIVIVSALGVHLTPRMTEKNTCLIKHARSGCCFWLLRVLVIALLVEFGMKHIDAAHCYFSHQRPNRAR
jgi:hypothetical protein